ncbi:MAG: helix-hairpin-helix domain-containing protein [Armatimonadota bacterium]
MSELERGDLAEIPGLGPVRRTALAEAGIHDLQTLLTKTVAELAAVRGIGMWQARKIHEYLRHRGLSLEEDAETHSVLVTGIRDEEDLEALAEAATALDAQAQREAELEAEVEILSDAVAAAQRLEPKAEPSPDGRAAGGPGEPAAEPEESEEAESEAEEAEDEEADSTMEAWVEEVRAQRDQLPETALSLMDAIRQAAVTRQLTRQLTRLLICSGEFVSDERQLGPEQRRRAHQILGQVDRALQRAIEKQAFSHADQKELATRIRKRRKQLEELLER